MVRVLEQKVEKGERNTAQHNPTHLHNSITPSSRPFSSNLLVRAVGARNQERVDMLLRAEKSLKGKKLLSELDDEEDPAVDEEEEKRKSEAKNEKLLGSVDKFSVTSIDEVIQVNNILGAVADPLPKENQGAAVDALLMLSGAVDKEAPLTQQKDFMAGALGTAANLMKGVNRNANGANSTGSLATRDGTLRRRRRDTSIFSNSSDELDADDEEFIPSEDDKDANEKVEKMLDVVGASQGALLRSSIPGEEPSTIDAGDEVNMAVAPGFFDASELEGRIVEVGGAMYIFPSYCSIVRQDEDCLTNKTITIGVQMAKWKGQVHGYGGGRDQLSDDSATMQLSLVDSRSMPIPVNNSLQDFIMYIPRAKETVQEPELVGKAGSVRAVGVHGSLVVVGSNDPQISPKLGLSVHTVDVPAPRVGVTILVRPENDTGVEDWVLVWSASRLNNTPEFMENIVRLSNLTYHEGTYSVGLGKLNYTIPEPEEHPCFEDPPNNTVLESFAVDFDTNYYFSAFTSSCLFFNKDLLTWSSDGCKVIGANVSVTVCSCNHLTSFASGFFVAPNAIDFAYVFANAGFADNLTIYLTLIISLSLYLIGLVYARIMDKKDIEKVGATPLADNSPADRYLYNIMVHTGAFPSSGTESKVQFLLVGDWNETEVRTLNEGTERPLLTRGASDHFVMATDRPLGPLQYLRIWHDNAGKGKKASWYFAYMVVKDIQTGEEFQFINNQWLAVEEGDGQIDRLIPVAGEQQLRDYTHVFSKTVEKNMSDDHLWFSVFLKPARSRFTRVQRLSACMALLYLSMLANAMFYQQVPDSPGSGGLNLGPFSVSPEAMGVGFMSNLVVFPPSFLIVFFFRKSRPRKAKRSRLKEALARQNPGVYGATLEAGEGPRRGKFTSLSASRPASSLALTQPSHGVTAAPEEKRPEEEKDRRRGRKLTLPWWCVIVAWVLCVISIGTAVFFLWAYGIQFGNDKATKWLTALITSIFSSALFTQPIKIYLMAMLLSWILKRPIDEHEDYDDDEEEVDLGSDEKYLHRPPSAGKTMNDNVVQAHNANIPAACCAELSRSAPSVMSLLGYDSSEAKGIRLRKSVLTIT
ncbi:polycystin-1-like protein 2 [Penaeus indicus]|uniref:polycystin-1-like protein 2 n=1 Tax=Penaeus indicus TaxID=29960 RepID=UPI00300D8E60